MCVPVPTADGVYDDEHELFVVGRAGKQGTRPARRRKRTRTREDVNVTVPVGSDFVPRDSVSVTVAVTCPI